MTDLTRRKPPVRRPGTGPQQTVRLACPCGRNLADLRLFLSPPGGTVGADIVVPVARPGVRQRGEALSFAWDCRCDRSWEARQDRLSAAWIEHSKPGRIIRLIFGTDL
jgi:hypothetical protein